MRECCSSTTRESASSSVRSAASGKNSGARDHYLAGGDVVEIERVEQHLFLLGRKLARGAGGADDQAEFVGRVDGAVADFVGAEGAQDEAGGAAHEHGQRTGDGQEEIHGRGDGQGYALGSLEG